MHLSGNRLSLSSPSSSSGPPPGYGLVMSGILKAGSHGEEAPAHGWSKPEPKTSPNKQLKLNIRTPAIKPDRDCPVKYFEKNLLQSITLLSGYQQLQERNRKLDEELKQGRQFTISYLIDELIKRKRDHEVVGRCVNILRSIKEEYEVVKVQIAEDALKKAVAVKVDKEVQCSAQYSHRSTQSEVKKTVEKGTQHVVEVVDEATEVPSTLDLDKTSNEMPIVIQIIEVETEDRMVGPDIARDQLGTTTQEIKDGGLQKPEGIKVQQATKEVQTDAVNLCTSACQPKLKKRVRFQTDESQQDSQSSHSTSNDFKRPILPMAPVNMFQSIIPQSILRKTTTETVKATRSNSSVPSRAAQASSGSKKLPKFSGRHLAKEELTRIYGSDLAGEMVQRNKSQGDAALKAQSSSELTSKTQPKVRENLDSEHFEMPQLERFDSKRSAQVDPNPSQDDFVPFTPQHHHRRHAQSNSNRSAQVDPNPSQDDFAPFTPQHHHRRHAQSNSNRSAQVDPNPSQDDFAPFTPQHHHRRHAQSNSKNLQHYFKQNKFFKQVSNVSCKRMKKEDKTAKATSTKQMEDHKRVRGPDKRLKSTLEPLDEDADSNSSFDVLDLSSSLRIDDDYGSDKEHDKRKILYLS